MLKYILIIITLSSCATTSHLISESGYQKEINLLTSADTCYAVTINVRKTGNELTYLYNGRKILFRQINTTSRDQVITGRRVDTDQLTAIYGNSLMGYDDNWLIQITPMVTNTNHPQVLIIATNKNICK
jgi:hypothetical protein